MAFSLMDDIKEIIARIVKACGQAGYEVPEILAAFVARTVSLDIFVQITNAFRLLKQMRQRLLWTKKLHLRK